jgi:hypothetical protein
MDGPEIYKSLRPVLFTRQGPVYEGACFQAYVIAALALQSIFNAKLSILFVRQMHIYFCLFGLGRS